MPDNGEAPKPNPDRPRQPEKATPKPIEAPKPQDATGIQRAVDALNITTPGVPDRADLQNLANAGQGPESNAVSGTPAEGMDLDPRYQAIRNELRQKWLAEHPGKDFLTADGQIYYNADADHLGPNDRGKPTLKGDTESWFRRQYPEDAKAYNKKEETRIYEDPDKDPLIKKTEDSILRSTNLDASVRGAKDPKAWGRVYSARTIQGWDSFINLYPEKAKAYVDKGHQELQRALASKQQRQQAEDMRKSGEIRDFYKTLEQTPPSTTLSRRRNGGLDLRNPESLKKIQAGLRRVESKMKQQT